MRHHLFYLSTSGFLPFNQLGFGIYLKILVIVLHLIQIYESEWMTYVWHIGWKSERGMASRGEDKSGRNIPTSQEGLDWIY